MRPAKLARSARANPAGVRFKDLCRLAEAYGFSLLRQKGSHRIYAHDGLRAIMNFQNDGGMAKAYQVRQLLGCAAQNGLKLEDE
ncbi:MAG: type II toxin-antitoxin system HicA family toxin [Elusimicrobia bacterium]|nr:type II toxin-antitoxin system HicA family toxin [Elusimicrobiota bacterium]